MPSIDNLELLEARISKLESLVGHFDKLDQAKVLLFVENFFLLLFKQTKFYSKRVWIL